MSLSDYLREFIIQLYMMHQVLMLLSVVEKLHNQQHLLQLMQLLPMHFVMEVTAQ